MSGQAETTQAGASETEPAAGLLAAEQVSLEVENHAGEYGDRLADYSFWYWARIISILVMVLGLVVLQYLRFSVWLTLPVLAGLVLLPNILPYVERRLRGRGGRQAFAVRPQARLRAMGRQDELATLQNLPDVPFEPVIVEHRMIGSASNFAMIILIGLIFYGVVNLTSSGFRFAISTVSLALFVVILPALQWFSVKYLRLVPGRLDVLCVSPLNRRIRVQSRYDLRTARVTVSFSTGQIEIAPAKGSSFKLPLANLSEPRRFVEGLFQAAVCTHPAPPLPDDALLG